jgi:hypothetical protein
MIAMDESERIFFVEKCQPLAIAGVASARGRVIHYWMQLGRCMTTKILEALNCVIEKQMTKDPPYKGTKITRTTLHQKWLLEDDIKDCEDAWLEFIKLLGESKHTADDITRFVHGICLRYTLIQKVRTRTRYF